MQLMIYTISSIFLIGAQKIGDAPRAFVSAVVNLLNYPDNIVRKTGEVTIIVQIIFRPLGQQPKRHRPPKT